MNQTFYFAPIITKDYKASTIIKDLLIKHNWKEIQNNTVTYSNKNSLSKIARYLDGLDNITLKHKLALNFNGKKFIPKTYVIINKQDIEKIPNNLTGLWFFKVSDMFVGSGDLIKVLNIRDTDNVHNILNNYFDQKYAYVLQRAINPLLINGKKFDLRLYTTIIYTPNEFASYILDNGIVRYSVDKYDKNSTNITKQLTNISVYKKNNLSGIATDVLTELYDKNHCMFFKFNEIKKIYSFIIKKIYSKIKKNNSFGFVVLGLDVIFDVNYNVYVLEINLDPTLYDDFSSVNSAYNYKYAKGTNYVFFKNFYELVFESLLDGKLKNNNVGNWMITNYIKS